MLEITHLSASTKPASSEVEARLSLVRRLMLQTQRWSFVRNTASLSVGTAVAQGFSVLAAPVLTRLYSPSKIGQLALFVSVVNVVSTCASLKYELGIVSAATEREAAQLTYVSVLLSIPISILSGVLMYIAIRFSLFGFNILPGYVTVLVIPALFLTAIFAALRYWEIRGNRFNVIAKATVGQHATRALTQVGLGLVRTGSIGLIIGEVLGRAIGVTPILRKAWPKIRRLLADVCGQELLHTLYFNRRLVIYSLPSTFIDTLVANVPVPFLVSLYGAEVGGYFALVQRVLAAPLSLVSASVADTFHGSLATCARESPSQMSTLFRRTSLWLFAIGLGPFLVLTFSGRSLFQVVLGNGWAVAGTLAAISAPWFLTQFVVSPLSRVVFVLSGQELKLLYDILIFVSMLLLVALASHCRFSVLKTVWAFSLINSFAYVIYYFVLLRIVSRSSS